MHMLHVTLGVIYLGVVALRRKFIPILLGLWLVAWLATPVYSPFHYGAHVLLLAAIVCGIILWLKPKVYDSSDVEAAGVRQRLVCLVLIVHSLLIDLKSAQMHRRSIRVRSEWIRSHVTHLAAHARPW